MIIRQENPNDYEEVYEVVRSAFASAEHADGTEQELVKALREGEAYIPELSLAAVLDDEIAGHIMFTKMKVGDQTALALAPLSVLPKYQNRKIGSRLVEEGHRRAAALGYGYVLVLGSDKYYPRFGYQRATQLNIELPDGFPDENFMVCKLFEEAPEISGKVTYAAEFGME